MPVMWNDEREDGMVRMTREIMASFERSKIGPTGATYAYTCVGCDTPCVTRNRSEAEDALCPRCRGGYDKWSMRVSARGVRRPTRKQMRRQAASIKEWPHAA